MKHFAVAAACAILLTGCGYHVSGRGEILPKTAQTIAVPAFANVTTRYRLTELLPAAITRELITRTRYTVIADPTQADIVLRGAVINYTAFPNVLDQQSGRAAGVQVSAYLQLSVQERATGKVVFNRPYMEFRQRYEIVGGSDRPASENAQYFEESETALTRLSHDVAKSVVSAILEAF